MDTREGATDLVDGPLFLCLGYKGSGKSALTEHLRLSARDDPLTFVDRVFLGDFPFSEFRRVVPGEVSETSRLPGGWSWLLLLRLMESLSKDQGASHDDARAFAAALRFLRSNGLLPSANLRDLVLRSVTKSLHLSLIPKFVEAVASETTSTKEVNFSTAVSSLQTLALGFRSESRHVVVIDGLDDLVIEKETQYETLSALVLEAFRLNTTFQSHGTRAKVIVLCRTDIFNRLPGSNTNKIRQDAGMELNWFQETQVARESNLLLMADRKAKVHAPDIGSLFDSYFPSRIRSKAGNEAGTLRFLLDSSRYTPRDFLQLLKAIQPHSGEGQLTSDMLWKGMKAYSSSYFYPEIRNELQGKLTAVHLDRGFELLALWGKEKLDVRGLQRLASKDGRITDFDVSRFLTLLYEAGALGNIRQFGDTQIFAFRYRDPNSPFDPSKRCTIHRGLRPALNIPALL